MDLQAEASTSSAPLKTIRARFADFNPSQITSLALTPLTWTQLSEAKQRQTVAVGRGNGEIHVMQWVSKTQGWVHGYTIPSSFPAVESQDEDGLLLPLISHLLFAHPSEIPLSELHLYSPDPLPYPEAKNDKEEEENAKIVNSNNELQREMERELRKIRDAKPRLFGIGTGGTEVIEWEWKDDEHSTAVRGSVVGVTPSRSGSIFSMATNPSHTLLSIGCQDSSIRILSIPTTGPLEHVAQWAFDTYNPTQKRKHPLQVLCMAWGPPRLAPPSGGHWSERDSYLVAGCTDSTIRKFDARSGKVVGNMKVERFKGEQTLVWTVGVLKDDTIISGDSLGNVKIWDGKLNTQLRNIKAHRADVLCMSINMDGKSFFTAGVDQRVSLIQLSIPSNTNQKSSRPSQHWSLVSSKHNHSHDIKAIAVSPSYSITFPRSISPQSDIPLVLSGGIDLCLYINNALPTVDMYRKLFSKAATPLREGGGVLFEHSGFIRCTYVPPMTEQTASVCPQRRWIVVKRGREVSVWKVGDASGGQGHRGPTQEDDDLPDWAKGPRLRQRWGLENIVGATPWKGKGEYRKLLEMDIGLKTDVTRCQISPDGHWLIVSDLTQTKLFFLDAKGKMENIIKPKRIKALNEVIVTLLEGNTSNTSCTTFHFSPDSTLLAISLSSESKIAVFDLSAQDISMTLRAVWNPWKHSSNRVSKENRILAGKKGKGKDDVDEEEIPSNRNACADVCISISNDNKWMVVAYGRSLVCIYDLQFMKFYTNLPTTTHFPHILSFFPSHPHFLLIGQSSNTFQVYDVMNKRIAPWFSHLVLKQSPEIALTTLSNLREPMNGVVWHPQKPTSAIFWSSDWIFRVDFKNALGRTKKKDKAGNKRAREEDEQTGSTEVAPKGPVKSHTAKDKLLPWRFIGTLKSVLAFAPLSSEGDETEFISVEKPFFTLLDELPAAWTRVGEYGGV